MEKIIHKNRINREFTGNNYPVSFAIFEMAVLAQAVFVNKKEFYSNFSINNLKVDKV